MNKLLYILLLFAVLLTPVQAAERVVVDGVAAWVDDEYITMSEVMASMRKLEMQLRSKYTGVRLQDELQDAYNTVLDELINQRLIAFEFLATGNTVPEDTVDAYIESIVTSNYDGDRALFRTALQREGMTEDDLRERRKTQIMVSSMRGQKIRSRVKVTPQMIRDAYDRRKKEFSTPAQVKVSMIVIDAGSTEAEKTSKTGLVKETIKELKSGADFAEKARLVSDDSSSEKGGDWGSLETQDLRRELADALIKLDVGQVSEPILIDNQYFIMRLNGRANVTVQPFKDVQPMIEDELKAKLYAEFYEEWIKDLRSRAFIRIAEIQSYK